MRRLNPAVFTIITLFISTAAFPAVASEKYSLILPDDIPIVDVDEQTKNCMQTMACVRDIFLNWTLGNDYEAPPPEYEGIGIVKVKGPATVQVVGAEDANAEAQEAMKRGLLDTLAILRSSGLDVRHWDGQSDDPISFVIFVSDDFHRDLKGKFVPFLEHYFVNGVQHYEDTMKTASQRQSTCIFSVFFEKGLNIVDGAMLLIPSDLGKRDLRLCFYEEIIQALGPSFDFSDDTMSIFTDREVRWFSEFDYLLVRLFFHPMIQPGMSRQQVIDVFPDLYRSVMTTAPACPSFETCLEETY